MGHAFNNVGIRMIGATKASIVGASSPALTVLRNFKLDSKVGDWDCHIRDRVVEWRRLCA